MSAVLETGPRAMLRPLAVAAAALLFVAAASWAVWEWLPEAGWRTVSVALAIAAAAGLGYLAGRRNAAVLHRAILRALEGHLEPIAVPGPPADGSVIADYNVLARRLRSLIEEMESSQLAIIGERNRIDAILRGLPCVMLAVDSDVRVTSSNDRAEALFGLPVGDLRGMNLFDLLKLDREGRELLGTAFLHDQQVSHRDVVLGVAGERRHFTLSVTFFRPSPDATIPSAVVMLQDVTDHRRLQQLAHQSEKFVALGQLAGGIAHELNTPLGTILGYAGMLGSGGVSEAKRTQYAQAIQSEAQRCARIIDNLLAYARRERCAPESCNVGDVIREVVGTIRDCHSRRYHVPIEVDLRDAHVLGGPGQLDIVLGNLIMNAVQAASDAADPRVLVEARSEEASAIVTVTDNGPGIPAEVQGRVFDPFFSTKEPDQGTGLGLAISQSIVMGIGGTLHCDAAYRGGARFILKLPLAGAAARRGDCAVA
ncbi:MAG TPA: ATP-binding protein [Usitatibacter sp.]|nr:ATP-binding protein [Usitatibacter sp.]